MSPTELPASPVDVPADMPFTKKWVVGYLDAQGEVAALANVISDPLAPGVLQTTERVGIAMGKRTNTLRVMVKPLVDNTLEKHLARVERDRPDDPTHPTAR